MAISTARQFFDEVVVGGTPFIESLVADRKHETEWLDFKGCENLSDDRIKKTWSEAVCGFGNNQGGVLIWGIDARKGADGIDAACDLKPHGQPEVLRSRLQQLLSTTVEPPLLGVEMKSFFQSGTTGTGYVACFVPESATKPHRAEMIENKPFKIRIGDAFITPSVSLLRSLFFPHSSPQLDLSVVPEWSRGRHDDTPIDVGITYRVYAKNTSAVSAKDLYIAISTSPKGLQVQTIHGGIVMPPAGGLTGVEFGRPLHPSSHLQLCVIRQTLRTSYSIPASITRFDMPSNGQIELLFDVYAADMIPLKVQVVFDEFDLTNQTEKRAVPRDTSRAIA